MSGTLYVVATPIGNLDDLSTRARQTLAGVDLVAAEDTRHTGRLLLHLGLKKPQFALHDHNEEVAAKALLERLAKGESVALVSDAGTPLVSDPGYRLIDLAHRHGIRISPIPGASALTAAMSVAGLPSDRFAFEGFLPARRSARRAALAGLAAETRTLVFYESVHRVAETIGDMIAAFGEDRAAFLGRELTKLHEQCLRGTLGELRGGLEEGSVPDKGEFVIAVAGGPGARTENIDVDRLLAKLAEIVPGRQAASIAASVTGGKRNALYRRLLELKDQPR